MSSRTAMRLRGEVEVLRARDSQSSVVSKKRALSADGEQMEGNLFETCCQASAPFITIGYLRQYLLAGAHFPRGGRRAIGEDKFKFPLGNGKEQLFAVVSSARDILEGSRWKSPEVEASEILELLKAESDTDLIFWAHLCLPLENGAARDDLLRVFNIYGVQSIMKCSQELSLVRLSSTSAS